MSEEFEVGHIVTGIYKTGKYIGEITAVKPNHYLVKVKNVLVHPTQGDLHNPKQANVPFFHERRALANGEQTNIMKSHVRRYEGELKSYEESLRQALNVQKEKLQQDDSEWAQKSLTALNELEKDYFYAG